MFERNVETMELRWESRISEHTCSLYIHGDVYIERTKTSFYFFLLILVFITYILNLHLLPDETIATTIEVVVDELWNTTVTRIPMTRAANGFTRRLSDEKTSPAVLPPSKRNAELRKVSEQMNR